MVTGSVVADGGVVMVVVMVVGSRRGRRCRRDRGDLDGRLALRPLALFGFFGLGVGAAAVSPSSIVTTGAGSFLSLPLPPLADAAQPRRERQHDDRLP